MDNTTLYLLLFSAAFGAFLITALFHFTLYVQQKDKVFLSYSIYLFLYTLFILVRILDGRLTSVWPLSYDTVYHADELLAKLTLVAYVNFMGGLFVTPDMRFHLAGWRIMRWGTYGYCLLYLILILIGAPLQIRETLSFISSIFLLGLGFFLIVKVFRFYKNPFYQLIIAGSLLLAFSTFSGVIYNMVTGSDKLNFVAYALMLTGGIPEIIFLSAALGYRLKTAYKERSQAQQELIIQLQKNEQLARTLNEELEQLVHARTQEIQEKSMLLEQEKEKKLHAEFDKQIAEAQLTALNAQMNPHFIFNCMNSIQKYILKNERGKALEFLQNFSALMRSVLDNSTKARVYLDDEIQMLRTYILLEQQRLDYTFDFMINVADELPSDFVEIPGMVIQPYIENAIWHGLMHKDGQGMLRLQFDRIDNTIQCIVEDNGVGRKKAAELETASYENRKRYGMSISKKRLELLHKEHEAIPEVRIEDLFDAEHAPAGTRVTLFFQLKEKPSRAQSLYY